MLGTASGGVAHLLEMARTDLRTAFPFALCLLKSGFSDRRFWLKPLKVDFLPTILSALSFFSPSAHKGCAHAVADTSFFPAFSTPLPTEVLPSYQQAEGLGAQAAHSGQTCCLFLVAMVPGSRRHSLHCYYSRKPGIFKALL